MAKVILHKLWHFKKWFLIDFCWRHSTRGWHFKKFFMLIESWNKPIWQWHTFSRLPKYAWNFILFWNCISNLQIPNRLFANAISDECLLLLFSLFFLTQMQIISFISECWKLLKHFLRMIWRKFFTKVWIKDSDNKTFEKNKKSVISRKVFKRILRNFDDVL